MKHLIILLRLAVLFHRNRTDRKIPFEMIKAGDNSLKLKFSKGWLEERQLTERALQTEQQLLQAIGFNLKF